MILCDISKCLLEFPYTTIIFAIYNILWQVSSLNVYLADHILIGYYHEDDEVLRSLSPEAESNIRLNSNSGQSSKRNSCACRKCSLFNFDDCDPKEATTVIKYLRFRKVYMVFKIIIFWKYLCHVEFINKMLTMSLLTYLRYTFFVKSQHSLKFVWPLFLGFRPFNW